MFVVYSPHLEAFQSPGQIHFGERQPSPEVPERSRQIVAALKASGLVSLVEPKKIGTEPIQAVHDQGYLDYLSTANLRPIIDPESDGQPAEVLFPAAFPFTNL